MIQNGLFASLAYDTTESLINIFCHKLDWSKFSRLEFQLSDYRSNIGASFLLTPRSIETASRLSQTGYKTSSCRIASKSSSSLSASNGG